MFLSIDTSVRDVITLSVFDEHVVHSVEQHASNRDVLKEIDALLLTLDLEPRAVAGVVGVVGEGSFTSSRLATTVANTFSYTNQIPVLAVSSVRAQDVQACIPDLLAQVPGQFVSATYSGVPNVTTSSPA